MRKRFLREQIVAEAHPVIASEPESSGKTVNPVNSMPEEPSNITMKDLEYSPEKIQVPNTLSDENRDPVSELTTHPALTGL